MKLLSIRLLAGVMTCVFAQQMTAAEAATETVLHSFANNGVDGASPQGGLIDVGGNLYGTTPNGGSNYCGAVNCGTVFTITKNGAESVLHSFSNNLVDGAYPIAALINVNGTLYGTTQSGGTAAFGTVFTIDPVTGDEAVLHSFPSTVVGQTDGGDPNGSLLNVRGKLYGTTEDRGAYGYGTVFSLDPVTHVETVLHSFRDNGSDGYDPVSNLIEVHGKLYGTTLFGGAHIYGTVFSIDPENGAETVVYSFCRQPHCADGSNPFAGLISVGGKLLGTTIFGGKKGAQSNGGGTVFSIDPTTGVEAVLHAFTGKEGDGLSAYSGLVVKGGTLYGTTAFGGTTGSGTLFSIDPTTGAETNLYSFRSDGTDGQFPGGTLLAIDGGLYGTTSEGGIYGYGTVFKIKL